MKLTPAETRIVRALRHGNTNADLAVRFCISKRTVENHVYRACQKLGVSNRMQASIKFQRMGR